MDGVRIVAREGNPGEDAVISSGSLEQKLSQQKTTPASTTAQTAAGKVFKVQLADDGTVASSSVTRREPPKASAPVSNDPLDRAENDVVGRVVRSNVGPDNVIRDPRLGGSMKVQAAVDLGWLRETADGYVWSGEMAHLAARPSNPAAAQAQPESQTPPPAPKTETPIDPNVMAGVRGTSEESDAVIAKLSNVSPISVEGMIATAAKGSVINYDEMGASLGEGGAAKLEAAVTQTREAGVRILSNLGVDPAAFETWITANPEQASTIARDMLTNRSTESLIRAGMDFRAQRAERVATIANAKNVGAKVENGVVMFKRSDLGLGPTPRRGDFGGDLWISESAARAAGLIDVVEQK